MTFSAVKHFFCSAAAVFCTLFLSGCIAMDLAHPVPDANETRDENLDGVWVMMCKDDPNPKEKFVFVIDGVEKHQYTVQWMLPNQVTFTIMQLPGAKQEPYRFACIRSDDLGNPENKSFTLVRYTSSPDEIGIYNITKSLLDGEDFRKLCRNPSKPNQVTAGADEVKKWCADHAEEMELIFTLKRIRFKTDMDRQKFICLSTFLQGHNRRMIGILAASKDAEKKITEEQGKEIHAEFETVKKWMSESKQMISPELAVIFEQYISMPVNGRKEAEVRHDLEIYVDLIGRIAYLQLLD